MKTIIKTKKSEEPLNEMKERFALEYSKDFNGTRAAIAAGYSKRTATAQASRLLTQVKVGERVKKHIEDFNKEFGVSKRMLVEELAKISFFDISSILTDEGALKPISEWDDKARAAIAGLETYDEFDDEGKKIGTTRKVKINPKIDAIVALARMLGHNEPDRLDIRALVNMPFLTVNPLKQK